MNVTTKKILSVLLMILFLHSGLASAKASKHDDTQTSNPRLKNLSTEDHELFNALTKKQQKMLESGKVEDGYNEWMVKLALGEPYYATEHSPVFVDYEMVWLYTKPKVEETATEEKIIDPQTNWPTVHRTKHIRTCTIGDFFLLFDRGVIQKTVPDTSNKVYGTCVEENTEEFLPIVNGKPIERKTP